MKAVKLTVIAALAGSIITFGANPALALGDCGPNAHRNAYGKCVFGGQNQSYCLRKTGHRAARLPDGMYRCFK